MDKVDQGYGQMIQENQILRMVIYPSMLAAHGLMVKLTSQDLLYENLLFQWLLSHFFPKISTFVAQLVDQGLILIFGGKFDPPAKSHHMAKYVFTFEVNCWFNAFCFKIHL